MKKKDLIRYIADTYSCEQDYPWEKYPEYMVFRHPGNKKWFVILMNIPKNKLGIAQDGFVDIVNVKCDPVLVGSLIQSEGFYPAYHMNKTHWITAVLDTSAPEETVKMLLDMSFELTATKLPQKKN